VAIPSLLRSTLGVQLQSRSSSAMLAFSATVRFLHRLLNAFRHEPFAATPVNGPPEPQTSRDSTRPKRHCDTIHELQRIHGNGLAWARNATGSTDSPKRSAVSRCKRQLNSSGRWWPASSISG
jgi:hypothetical protein